MIRVRRALEGWLILEAPARDGWYYDPRATARADRQAPSAVNAQPWHFIVVDEPVLKERLASTGWFRSFIKDCSFVVVGLYKPRNPRARPPAVAGLDHVGLLQVASDFISLSVELS